MDDYVSSSTFVQGMYRPPFVSMEDAGRISWCEVIEDGRARVSSLIGESALGRGLERVRHQ